jgi:hypothetical protein
MNFIISQELAQRLLDYLAAKPYAEVFEIVAALQGMPKEIKEEKTDVQNPD